MYMYVATAQSNNYMPAVSTSLLRDGGTALYSLVRHNERYVVGSAHNVARSRLNGDINFRQVWVTSPACLQSALMKHLFPL